MNDCLWFAIGVCDGNCKCEKVKLMKIDFINFPYVYTNTGERIMIKNINGSPSVGATLKSTGKNEDEEDLYDVTGSDVDPDCVGGVCPIK